MNLAVIILTKNEKLHIGRCLEKLAPLRAKVTLVVDCFSTDGTQEIAKRYGASVVEHAWPGLYAPQLNWGIEQLANYGIKIGDWVLRIDADEYLFPETIEEVNDLLPKLPDAVTSLSLSRSRTFLGKRVYYGVGKLWLTRFFRYGYGRCEIRLMDEHIVTTEGRDLKLKSGFIDDNLNGFEWWQKKHEGYSRREAGDLLRIIYGSKVSEHVGKLNFQTQMKRLLKGVYAYLPKRTRAWLYAWIYRYVFKLGFLDGKAGYEWIKWQGAWYRNLVDEKVAVVEKAAKKALKNAGLPITNNNLWPEIQRSMKTMYDLEI